MNEAVSTRFRIWCMNGSPVDWRVGEPYGTGQDSTAGYGEAERVGKERRVSGLDWIGLMGLRVSNARASRKASKQASKRPMNRAMRMGLARQGRESRVHNSCKKETYENAFKRA